MSAEITAFESYYAQRGTPLYSGVRLDFLSPRKDAILLCDIAECLARTDAAFAESGFYTLAQRSVIMAEHVAGTEGALAACYGLLHSAGLALIRSVPPFNVCAQGLVGLTSSFAALQAAVHDAMELDWPCPPAIGKRLQEVDESLQLRELLTLRHNVEPEIARLRAMGVTPLSAHLAPLPRDKAFSKWVGTWKVMATAAQLPRTPAWRGMA